MILYMRFRPCNTVFVSISYLEGCPEHALSFDDGTFRIDTGKCLGTACQRCKENCPQHVYDYSAFEIE